jgi:hypothetical protein
MDSELPRPDQRIYSNAIAANGGPYDVTIHFYQRLGDAPSEIDPLISVTMSWEHAASMAQILGEMVTRFEAEAGAIPRAGSADSQERVEQ